MMRRPWHPATRLLVGRPCNSRHVLAPLQHPCRFRLFAAGSSTNKTSTSAFNGSATGSNNSNLQRLDDSAVEDLFCCLDYGYATRWVQISLTRCSPALITRHHQSVKVSNAFVIVNIDKHLLYIFPDARHARGRQIESQRTRPGGKINRR